jgi:CubicO group peptidase (beta-lactamase class C family)
LTYACAYNKNNPEERMYRPFSVIAVAWFCLATLAACEVKEVPVSDPGPGVVSNAAPVDYVYAAPAYTGDGWATSDLAAAGFDVGLIENMMRGVLSGEHPGIDSVAVVRHGKLLLDWHDPNRVIDQYDMWVDNRRRDVHSLHSTTKSVTSALVGIAIDQAYIASTEVPFYSLFHYANYRNWDDRKYGMTLDDALTMRLGLQWDEWSVPYTSTDNSLAKLNNNHDDWTKALLDLPLYRTPGTDFRYNTAATTAIGQALENVTGLPLDSFADAYLFDPMQITTDRWGYSPTGLPIGGSGLYLSTRDLVKFGQLYLDGGTWQGRRLISEAYVRASVMPRVDVSGMVYRNQGYGYQWWLGQFMYQGTAVDYWETSGYGGQLMFIVPSLDLVVALTGHNYENDAGVAHEYFVVEHYILGAITDSR